MELKIDHPQQRLVERQIDLSTGLFAQLHQTHRQRTKQSGARVGERLLVHHRQVVADIDEQAAQGGRDTGVRRHEHRGDRQFAGERSAVKGARAAFEEGSWSKASPARRKHTLIRFAELLREHADELALLETIDMGKPIAFSTTVDIPGSANTAYATLFGEQDLISFADRDLGPAQNVFSHHAAVAGDAINLLEARRERASQGGVDFRLAPQIIFSFLAFGIGIESGGEAVTHLHFPQHPVDGFADAFAAQRSHARRRRAHRRARGDDGA